MTRSPDQVTLLTSGSLGSKANSDRSKLETTTLSPPQHGPIQRKCANALKIGVCSEIGEESASQHPPHHPWEIVFFSSSACVCAVSVMRSRNGQVQLTPCIVHL